jgi:hypothetical protein
LRPKQILDQSSAISFTNSERVKVKSLDEVGTEIQNGYLKIHFQGAEMKVLQGATGTFKIYQ